MSERQAGFSSIVVVGLFEPVAALKTGTRAKPSIARTLTHIYIVAFDSYLFIYTFCVAELKIFLYFIGVFGSLIYEKFKIYS